ncbi:hypothetical protein Nepgr_033674 [Nepenthes gracilis]|uniref:Uncharacterized protein n=1 Tax=Nepenthes gracilis TaxID=150966 RepID=A0AAD3Y8J5_NEPGR|nr:hypothetical protein Nepgr_033674 [Nepenthes gracilis]
MHQHQEGRAKSDTIKMLQLIAVAHPTNENGIRSSPRSVVDAKLAGSVSISNTLAALQNAEDDFLPVCLEGNIVDVAQGGPESALGSGAEVVEAELASQAPSIDVGVSRIESPKEQDVPCPRWQE